MPARDDYSRPAGQHGKPLGHGRRSRRQFLGGSAAVVGAGLSRPLLRPADPAQAAQARAAARATQARAATPPSTFFSTAFVEYASSCSTASDGDLWANCWADDGNIYAANGDGTGFGTTDSSDVVVNQITGTPETGISGQRLAAGADVANVWGDPSSYNRKPTGMACVDGVLYLAVQDLRTPPCPPCFNDAPNASISSSTDHGQTWLKTTEPMFTDYRFTTVFFLDFGQDYGNARAALGPADGRYVYAYGLDWNWRDSYSATVPNPVDVYLARVPRGGVTDITQWEFFAGLSRAGKPSWSNSIDAKVAVLHDDRTLYTTLRNGDQYPYDLSVISQGSVVYNQPLDRYIYTSWTEYTFEFYEAPHPWGPWTWFFSHDAGGYPWFGTGGSCPGPKNGGYASTIPSKFISADGQSMWLQSNWFVGAGCGNTNYDFNLRQMRLTRYAPSVPANHHDPSANLAQTGEGVTPTEKSAHYGHWQYYNDGNLAESEDSFDQSNKLIDWWGYTFSRAYNMDRVVYTTGTMFPDGGWFSSYGGGLRVQVRQDFTWRDVTGLKITPGYPYDNTAGPNQTYTLRFHPTWGDGVRIIGQPAGTSCFTSIAELEIYYG
jgi:hypothetical protein